MPEIETHPVQANRHRATTGRIPTVVSMKAYEVYLHIYGPQKSLVTGDCRGGFGTGELIAFLYAATFPKDQWKGRVDEAFEGMKDI